MSRRSILRQVAESRLRVTMQGTRRVHDMATHRPGADGPPITVKATLFADLRRFLPRGADGPQPYSLPAGSTVGDLLDTIGVEAAYDVTVGVNGELADRGDVLPDGADVMLLSPMEGGSSGAARV
jgi:sulfur carrier protein ThiS